MKLRDLLPEQKLKFNDANIRDTFRGIETPEYRIVKTAHYFSGEDRNVFALLDMKRKKVVSWSITGYAEVEKFKKITGIDPSKLV